MGESDSTTAGGSPPIEAKVLDGLLDPVMLVSKDQRIVDVNQAARGLLGTDIVGSELAQCVNSDQIVETVANVLAGNPGTRTEAFIPFPVAMTFDVSVWRLPDPETEGPAWAMVVLHDVTPAKKAEQMRADFVSNVSHELRSPLASLLGFIETLRGPAWDDPEATERFLKIMAGEGQRMTRLIDELLVLAKVESDEHIRPEGSVEIGEILATVARSLSLRSQERKVTINLDTKAPKLLLAGDKDQLTQVFHNLIDNAINYGLENSTVRVAVGEVPTIPGIGAAGLSVSVTNRGEGIPQEEIPRLTERFYRVDKGRSRSMGGTGLGLAIVKHIVARHRGHLAIESVPGKETTFTVFLPRIEGETPPFAPPFAPTSAPTSAPPTAPPTAVS